MVLKSFWDKIRSLDAYPKTLEDFRIKTYAGATVSILSIALMTVLFVSELRDYLETEINEELYVDTSRGQKIKINLDVILHKVPCTLVSIDAVDISGTQQINVVHTIYKKRLTLNGEAVSATEGTEQTKLGDITKEIVETLSNNATTSNCSSCYGAETAEMPCCKTCDDVRDAYRRRGWALENFAEIEQCKREGLTKKIRTELNEGCQVYGHLLVNRVGGNFHIAPGHSFQQHHIHIHDIQPYSSNEFNLTHTIRHISFGDDIPGMVNPLDSTYSAAETGATMFQYYVKIVPASYVYSNGTIIKTNQYSVTRHEKPVSLLSGDSGMPGVFFSYDIAPLMVQYTEKPKSFMHFLTGVCAIIGGIFTVAGLIDSLIYHSARVIQRKIEIGKLS